MDEEFESFVVTNPDLVDEGIDVSGLKTTTDASILGNIPDGPGIQYEAYNPNRLSDLIRFYSGGFPMLDVPQAVAPVTTTPDTGGGGGGGGGGGMDQATGSLDLGGNTDFEQSLLDQGIGVQGAIGDPVVAPGEIPVTQQEMDNFNAIPVTPQTFADTGRQDLLDQAGNVQDIGYATDYFPEYNFGPQPGISNPRAPGQNTITQDTTAMDTTPSAPPGILNPYQEPMTQQDLIDSDANVGFVNAPSFEPEQQGIIDQAFSKVGSTASDIMNDLSQIPGAVADFANQTVDVFGKKINVGGTLLKAGINKIVGGPISLVFDVLKGLDGMLPEGGRGDVSDALGKKYGMDDIGRLTGGPMAGYSVGKDHAQTVQNRIDNIENRSLPQTDASRQKIAELEAYKAEVIGIGSSGVISEPGTVVGPGEMPVTQDEIDTFNEPTQEEKDAATAKSNAASVSLGDARYGDGGPGYEGPSSVPADDYDFSDFDVGDDSRADPTGTGNFSDTVTGNDTSPGATGGEGGGGTGGSTKIVCTMMNESYGFGSFRNKIWLKNSKNMAPEYQIGYHKIFLPLVKIAKTNNVVKKVLEHIAVHRTIDIRQESRGKTYLLGRVYRKILEPICYLVGKYAK